MEGVRQMTLKGSFTVEASFVVPFITFILAAMLFLMMTGHDTVIMHSCLYRSCEQAVFSEHAEAENPSGSLMAASASVSAGAGNAVSDALRLRVSASGSVSGTARYPGFARPFTRRGSFDYGRDATVVRIDYVGDILRDKLKDDLTG